jgi:Transmembrane domain of unknown function (DUF3566)
MTPPVSAGGLNMHEFTTPAVQVPAPAQPQIPPKSPSAGPVHPPRKARLRLVEIDPWSVTKVSFLFALSLTIITLVAVALLWLFLDVTGVFHAIGQSFSDVSGSDQRDTFDPKDYLSLSGVLGFTALLCVIEAVLVTALATVAAHIYNLCADFMGGIEVTLAEDQ